MAAVGNVIKGAVTAAGGVLGQLLFGKKSQPTKTAAPLPSATPRSNSVLADALAARVGSAGNQRTGSGGAESRTTGRKGLMGQ